MFEYHAKHHTTEDYIAVTMHNNAGTEQCVGVEKDDAIIRICRFQGQQSNAQVLLQAAAADDTLQFAHMDVGHSLSIHQTKKLPVRGTASYLNAP